MSEVFEDSQGRPYMKINGERVYLMSRSHRSNESGSNRARKSSHSTSSGHSTPNSVASLPELYKESAQSRHSRRGHSDALYGELSGRNSDPGLNSQDYYRDSISKSPPRRGTPFRDRYEDYKDKDAVASGAEDNYRVYASTAGNYSRKERQKSPGEYVGQPTETRDWHGTASGYAGRTSVAYQHATHARREHSRDFIGYDSQTGASGHAKRVELLDSKSRRWDRRREEHDRYNKS